VIDWISRGAGIEGEEQTSRGRSRHRGGGAGIEGEEQASRGRSRHRGGGAGIEQLTIQFNITWHHDPIIALRQDLNEQKHDHRLYHNPT
jgi:hypothetical protein